MNVFELLLTGLATWQIVEVLHHADITLSLRIRASESASLGGLRGFFSKLLSCPFCLSHWVAGALVVCLFLFKPVTSLPLAPLCVFAAAKLANLGNDLTYDSCRSPKVDLPNDIEVTDGTEDPHL